MCRLHGHALGLLSTTDKPKCNAPLVAILLCRKYQGFRLKWLHECSTVTMRSSSLWVRKFQWCQAAVTSAESREDCERYGTNSDIICAEHTLADREVHHPFQPVSPRERASAAGLLRNQRTVRHPLPRQLQIPLQIPLQIFLQSLWQVSWPESRHWSSAAQMFSSSDLTCCKLRMNWQRCALICCKLRLS